MISCNPLRYWTPALRFSKIKKSDCERVVVEDHARCTDNQTAYGRRERRRRFATVGLDDEEMQDMDQPPRNSLYGRDDRGHDGDLDECPESSST